MRERVKWNQVNLAWQIFEQLDHLLGMFRLVIYAIQHYVFDGYVLTRTFITIFSDITLTSGNKLL